MIQADGFGDLRCALCGAHARDCSGEHTLSDLDFHTQRRLSPVRGTRTRTVSERARTARMEWEWSYRPDPSRTWLQQSIHAYQRERGRNAVMARKHGPSPAFHDYLL